MSNKKRDKKQEHQFLRKAIWMEIKEHKSSFVVFCILRFLVIVAMVRQLQFQNYQGFFLCILTLVLLYVPGWAQVRLKIELPIGLEIAMLCFVFAAEILGEINEFYIVIPFWDTILHTLNGFLCAAIGFSLVLILNDDEHLTFDLSPFFLAVVAFCFSMTVGVLWEFFEWAMDSFFMLDMQKDTVLRQISTVKLDPALGNKAIVVKDIEDVILVYGEGSQQALGLGGYLDIGLQDTMKDLLVNFIGAVVFSVVGYFYAKSKGKERNTLVSLFVPSKKNKEHDFLEMVKTVQKEDLGEGVFTEEGVSGCEAASENATVSADV